MLEYISIRQTGFGVRREYKVFLERYGCLARSKVDACLSDGLNMENYQRATAALFEHCKVPKYHWRLGKTLVFMCDEQLSQLEQRLDAHNGVGTFTLQAPDEEGCMCRVRHERQAAIRIQVLFIYVLYIMYF